MNMAIDAEQVKEEARRIMDAFMKSMGDIELEEDFVLLRKDCFREEGEGRLADEEFRSLFLLNAPKVKGDAILAQKGKWLE